MQLTATTRSALGRSPSHDLGTGRAVDPTDGDGLLFKVSDSANGSSAARSRSSGPTACAGSVTSGDFCGIPGDTPCTFSRLSFSDPSSPAAPGRTGRVSSSEICTGRSRRLRCLAELPSVRAKSGPQSGPGQGGHFLRLAGKGAPANPPAEDPGLEPRKSPTRSHGEWNGLLGPRCASRAGQLPGAPSDTALYHSLLFPSVFSDDNGRYIGFDHRIHTVAQGEVQYANFSEADIYRTEVPLLAVLLPGPTSQMVQSLLMTRTKQKGASCPNGRSPTIDARVSGTGTRPTRSSPTPTRTGHAGFSLTDALKAMIHGATVSENGL